MAMGEGAGQVGERGGSMQGLRGHLPFRHHDQLQLAVGRSRLPDLPPGLHLPQLKESLLVAGSRWLGAAHALHWHVGGLQAGLRGHRVLGPGRQLPLLVDYQRAHCPLGRGELWAFSQYYPHPGEETGANSGQPPYPVSVLASLQVNTFPDPTLWNSLHHLQLPARQCWPGHPPPPGAGTGFLPEIRRLGLRCRFLGRSFDCQPPRGS
ncbi:GHRHR isoform 3 [Pongo abelii]|uniref:GHRHR isoform 3 n=1 Tax=Pongo abelii TaxID=9601 RepID=A0A2J8UNY9_PONAB|nr:GHRHR isoform 3 [Pongo abelii]